MAQVSEASCCAVSGSGLPLRAVPRRRIHCVLPSSPWLADSKTNIPLGLLYIAAVLREAGHDVQVTSRLDYHQVGSIHLSPEALACDLHLIGFCTPQFGEALHLAATIKDLNPQAVVVAGGPHPSYEPREVKEAGRQDAYYTRGVLRTRRGYRGYGPPLFDSVVVMEGERAILQLLSDLDQGALQPYYYGDKSEVPDLDQVPFPAWDLLPRDHLYNDGAAMMKEAYFPNADYPDATSAVRSLIGTRGCPYKCFAAGTTVRLWGGVEKPIEKLVLGDTVVAFNRYTGILAPRVVRMIGSRHATDLYRVRLSDGNTFTVTGDHPFVTPDGWQHARDFVRGTLLRRVRGAEGAASQPDVFSRVCQGSDPAIKTGRSEPREAPRGSSADLRDRQAAGAGTCSTDHPTAPSRSDPLSRGRFVGQQTGGQRADDAAQSDAPSRGGQADGRDTATSLPGRQAPPVPITVRGWFRTRAAALRGLCRRWLTRGAQWGPDLLDWAVSLRAMPEPGYATPDGAPGDSLQRSVLAHAGGHRGTATGLPERGMGSAALLGGGLREYTYGPCPSYRVLGDWVGVESVTYVGAGTVYPLSVEGDETFIANGLAVHNCTYCSTPWIGQAPRYRSPQNITAEIQQALDLGIRQLKMQDDTFSLHRSRLRDLALYIDAHLGAGSFAMRIHTRVNTMSPHVVESLKLMNCRATCFGIESGAQAVLDANQKGTTVAQNTLALQIAHDAGFRTIAFLVLGMSGETAETLRETQAWLLSVKPYLDQVSCSLGIPYPGSRWWTHPEASGITILDYNYDNQWLVGFSARDEVLVKPHGMSVDDLHRGKQEMFQFLRAEGWARSEWDEDVKLQRQLQEVCS